jgi:hypothetical protein
MEKFTTTLRLCINAKFAYTSELTVDENNLFIETILNREYLYFSAEDISSIEPYWGNSYNGIKIIHSKYNYYNSIVLITNSPYHVLYEISKTGFGNRTKILPPTEFILNKIKEYEHYKYPLKKNSLIILLLLLVICISFDSFYNVHRINSVVLKGPMFFTSLFVFSTSTLIFFSYKFKSLIFTKNADLSRIIIPMNYILLISGFFFLINIFNLIYWIFDLK